MIALAGLDHQTFGGLPVMVEKAKADDSGTAARAPSMPMARDPAVAVAEAKSRLQEGNLEGKINGGGPKLVLKTGGGNIEILKQ